MFGTSVLFVLKGEKMIKPELYVNHQGINEGRVILHSDLNNFFASVECRKRPDLDGFCVAVCGSVKDRHGIVLAKNELAKKHKIKTGQPIWQAKNLCPGLVILPPDYNEYLYYSGIVGGIYSAYSDRVEPFGMDEAWIDITRSCGVKTLDDGVMVAHEIRRKIKKETGLTVSIGVSDNKVFSKLASDYKKPDAVTKFGPDNYARIISDIDISQMLFVGRSTKEKLHLFGINKIKDVAVSNETFMKGILGVNGVKLYNSACGFDSSAVQKRGQISQVKSIGNSVTLSYDLNAEQVKAVFHSLAENVARRLRKENFTCTTVQISVKDLKFSTTEKQCSVRATSNAKDIAKAAIRLYYQNYDYSKIVRAVGLRTTNFVENKFFCQSSLFEDKDKDTRLDFVVDKICTRYGNDMLKRAVCCLDSSNFDAGKGLEIK